MKLKLVEGLPFVGVSILFQGRKTWLEAVLLDTGSAGTILAADRLAEIGLTYAPDDEVHRIRGVGGVEFVFTKRVDLLSVGELNVNNFTIEVGAMDYGFSIDGILGMDFLTSIGAIIDLDMMEIRTQ